MSKMSKQENYVNLQFLEDGLLWNAFKSGDRRAYGYIYQKNVRLLFTYGSKLTKDRDLVKDCIQDLFVYLWDRREKLGQTDHISYYLFKSLRRSIVAKLLKAGPINQDIDVSPDYNFKIITSCETDLIEIQSSEDYNQKLAYALDQLPERQKEAIYLKYYQNLSFEEIASVMSINRRSVYKLIHKAIDCLQQSLQPLLISLFLLVFHIP